MPARRLGLLTSSPSGESMYPFEVATMIAAFARPKITPVEDGSATVSQLEPVRRVRRVSPVRRTVGHWLIGLGGTLAGR